MGVLITGGTKGIGRGIALRLAQPGTKIFLSYAHDDDAAAEAEAQVAAAGAEVFLVKGDVGTPEGVDELLAVVGKETDRIDVLVHGAVVPTTGPILDLAPADFRAAVDLNGSALLWLVQAARPLLQRGSSIFFLSSRGSKVAVPNYAAIGAPKALAEAIIRYLAVELAPDGVRANIVSSSGVLTDAIRKVIPDADERFAASALTNPSGRNLEIEDIANAVAWLASDQASMMTGREIFLDGGLYTKAG